MVKPPIVQTIMKQAHLESDWQDIEEEWELENLTENLSMSSIDTDQRDKKQIAELHDLYTEIYEQRMMERAGEKYMSTDEMAPSYKQFERTLNQLLEENPDKLNQKHKVSNLRDLILGGYNVEISENNVQLADIYDRAVIDYEGPTQPEHFEGYE